ncbi:beta-microseminoprotein-like [Discoglossus pictus]
MMNNFLLYAISAALLVTACNGQCNAVRNELTDGCIVNGIKYQLNTEWDAPDCFTCTCSAGAYTCCKKYSTPTEFSSDCISFLDEKNCIYRVVRKDDPSKSCEVTAAVG